MLASAVDLLQMENNQIIAAAATTVHISNITNSTLSALKPIDIRQQPGKSKELLTKFEHVSHNKNHRKFTSYIAPITSENFKCRFLLISGTSSGVCHMNVRYELNSHANTSVVGRHCLVTHLYQDIYVNVPGDPILGTVKDLDIVNAALAYDCPIMGHVVIF